ncbi:hypothetical protein TcasGA2_TC010714 [Tribolium castaneum]|uniref:Peptidase aspartic putative domain-containing protein n=1 Tax=Tribolium castaneum TaxID=7070 RepID=D7EKN2_TRICA|nr:hypothetical protein TcasGA2_TC010714 [Tribolium castaneum]
MAPTKENELKSLQGKRQSLFLRIQRLYNDSRNLDDETVCKNFKIRYNTLEETRRLFSNCIDSINLLSLELDSDYTPSFAELEAVDELYCHIVEAAKKVFTKTENLLKPVKAIAKLPKIELMEFSGEMSDWPIFYDTFRTLIHENPDLDDITRMHYLLGKLTGKALLVCSGIQPTGANYPILWKALVEKYDDKRLLANAYLSQILDFRPLQNESVVCLNTFLEKFDTAVNALKQVDIENLSDFIISSIALSKLDGQTRRHFELSQKKSEIPLYKEIVDFVKDHTKILACTLKSTATTANRTNYSAPFSKPSRTHSLVVSNRASNNICPICNEASHLVYQCAKLLKLDYRYTFEALDIDQIIDNLPDRNIPQSSIENLLNLPLADEKFFESGEIDGIISGKLFPQILGPIKVEGSPGSPIALETTLGHIVMGEIPRVAANCETHSFCLIEEPPLDKALEKFWSMEEVPSPSVLLNKDDAKCEELFVSTVKRKPSGKYIVSLPFKEFPPNLGSSFQNAFRRYLASEKKFRSTPAFHQSYCDAIQDFIENFPLASGIVNRDTYMNDVVTSVPTSEEAIPLYRDLIGLFGAGGFSLTKWTTKSNELMSEILEPERCFQPVEFSNDSLKILDFQWHPQTDSIGFKISVPDIECTKRNILSKIARIWDPLGLLAPVTLYAKLLIREIWVQKLGWDDPVSADIQKNWSLLKRELHLLENFKIPRHLGTCSNLPVKIDGFADASQKGYGAVVYVRVPENAPTVRIICARSKVAPLKSLSIPRLDLCAALLLARLIHFVECTFQSRLIIENIVALTDSLVVLNWINASSYRWHTFVANRVAKIQELVPSVNWFHVDGKENPADPISKGLTPAHLLNHPIWLTGPSCLFMDKQLWSINSSTNTDKPPLEEKPIVLVTFSRCVNPLD